jgi:hypothetical protein
MQLKCYDYGFQNDWSCPIFFEGCKEQSEFESIPYIFGYLAFFNVHVTYLCDLNCKINFHMLYGSCEFKLSLSRGCKEFWHEKKLKNLWNG